LPGQRIAFAIGTILVAALAVLLFAPSFIDWSNYRAAFESRLANATGRTVAIKGDVSLKLFPRPALQVDGVSISSLPGASSPEFVNAQRVAVNLAFAPMLQGRFQFTSIEIVEPVIYLEVLVDGSQTWMLAPRGPARPTAGVGLQNPPFDLVVDALVIVDGTINYTDMQRDIAQSFSNVDIELGAGSRSGPFDALGEITAFGLSWRADVSIGKLRRDRPSAIVMTLANVDSGLTLDLTGSVTFSENAPVIGGSLQVFGESVTAALKSFDLVPAEQSLPRELSESFRTETRFSIKKGIIDAESIALRVGRTMAQGEGSFSWQDGPTFDLNLSVSRLDLTNWQFAASKKSKRFTELPAPFSTRAVLAQGPILSAILPSKLSGAFELDIGIIAWRGQVMRNGLISAFLKDSIVTLTDMQVFIPGNTRIDMAGTVNTNSGKPDVNLTVGATSRDLRSLLDWLDIAPSQAAVAPSRLNYFSMSSNISGTSSRLAIKDIKFELDTTAIDGSIILDDLSPLKATIELSTKALDLDAYLPALMEQLDSSRASIDRRTGGVANSSRENTADRNFLSNIASEFEVFVGALTVESNVFRGVTVSGKTEQDTIIIEAATVADFVGAELSSSGQIKSVLTKPAAQDMRFSLSTSDLSRVDRALGLGFPSIDLFLGDVVFEGSISGSIDDSKIDLSSHIGGLTVSVSGEVKTLVQFPTANVSIRANHKDYYYLLSQLGFNRSEAKDQPISLSISADVEASSSMFRLQKIDVGIGKNTLTGTLDYRLSDVRPRLSGVLDATLIEGDLLIPIDEGQQLTRASGRRGATGTGNISRRWSNDPIDLGFLKEFDSEIKMNADRLQIRGIDIDQFTATAILKDGILSLKDWRGDLYGGPSHGDFTLKVGSVLEIDSDLIITDAALRRLVEKNSEANPSEGRLAIKGSFNASGRTPQEIVKSLTGEGMFSVTGIDSRAEEQDFSLAVVLAPVRALSQLGGVFSGGVTEGLASFGAEFYGSEGVFSLSHGMLESNVYSGVFSGDIDFPRWLVDARGHVTLEVNLITKLMGNRLQMPNLIPITVQGPLDLPNVTINAGLPEQAEQTGESSNAPEPETDSSLMRTPTELFQSILNDFTNPK